MAFWTSYKDGPIYAPYFNAAVLVPPCWHIIYKRTFRTHFRRKVRLSEFLLVSNRYKQTLGKPWFLLDPFLAVSSLLRQETAKFMYKFIHKQLPVSFENYFNSVL